MNERAIAVSLKIPDNAAYTALTTLQRLGIDVARVERSDVLIVAWDRDTSELVAEVERNEAVFNPNKHRLTVLEAVAPRAGEVWIDEMGRKGRFTGWRLIDAAGKPASRAVLEAAAERLLCNPAIERAILPS